MNDMKEEIMNDEMIYILADTINDTKYGAKLLLDYYGDPITAIQQMCST